MNTVKLFFPKQSRSFAGQRWVNILFRSLHLIGITGVGSAFLFNVASVQWQPYMRLTVISGSAMAVLETWHNGIWLTELRGLATLLKLAMLALTFVVGLQPAILFAVILISAVMSHAPAKVRYYSLYSPYIK